MLDHSKYYSAVAMVLLGGAGCVTGQFLINEVPRMSHDYALQERVQRIGTRLTNTAERVGCTTHGAWHVGVYDAMDTDAMTSGNGMIAVGYTFAASNGDHEVAAILAHEIAHDCIATYEEEILFSGGSSLLLDGTAIALGIVFLSPWWVAALPVVGAEGIRELTDAAYSRSQEEEADTFGLTILCAAGYPGAAMANMFKRLRALYGADTGILDSHPPIDDRIRRARILAPLICRQ